MIFAGILDCSPKVSESEHHRCLVRALGSDIASDSRWSHPPVVFFDLQDLGSSKPPPCIGTNRPDVFARDISTGRTLIGEAKTTDDIDNQHTTDQLTSYFDYLRTQSEGELWIGVPWLSAGTVIRVCKFIRKRTNSENIPICVIAYMLGPLSVRRVWRE